MRLELKDIITITISITALVISLYQLWDVRRKKLKIYFGSDIQHVDNMIIHYLVFSVINKSNKPLHIFDTKFYLYPLIKRKFRFSKSIGGRGIQANFGSTEGHLYNDTLDADKPYKIQIEAYDLYSYYLLKKQTVRAIMIELLDLDGKKYKQKVFLNQLGHDENNRLSPKEYCFPTRFYKYEDKIRKQKRKRPLV